MKLNDIDIGKIGQHLISVKCCRDINKLYDIYDI